MIEQTFVLAVFTITLILIITEKIHRSVAVIVAATALIVSGVLNVEEAIHYVDFETLLLLAGMMLIVEVLKELGLFHYVAIKMVKSAKNYKKFFMSMCFATGLLSPFLDSVTVVLIFSTITIAVCKIIKKDPRPLLLSQVFCSNIGGNATLIGEPTNIMVSTHAGLTFLDFVKALTPATVVNLAIAVILLTRLFRVKEESILDLVKELDESSFIKDHPALLKATSIFIFTIILFTIHNFITLSPAAVALLGACLMILVVKADLIKLLSKIEWGTLVFIGGFFIIVGGLMKVGVTHQIAEGISGLPLRGEYLILFICFISALITGFIDNIPFVAVMIPVIDELSKNMDSTILWWTLLIGANFGGNLTPIAASPNIVVIAVSEREGSPIPFKGFVKVGVPIGLLTIGIALAVILTQHVFNLI